MTNVQLGSLALQPKSRYHVTGDGDDGTTTRHGKALAMVHGIDLRSPAATSMQKHKARRKAIVYAGWTAVVIAVAVLALRWLTP